MSGSDYAKLAKLIEDGQKQLGEMKQEIVGEISNIIEKRMGMIEKRVDALEMAMDDMSMRPPMTKPFDSDKTLVAYRLDGKGDDVKAAEALIGFLGVQGVKVVNTKRMNQRDGDNRPGLLKIELESEEQKVVVLRQKEKLKGSEFYDKVYVRSSQSHAERMNQMNMKTLMSLIPGADGQNLYFTGNGRLQTREDDGGRYQLVRGRGGRGGRGTAGRGGRGGGGGRFEQNMQG
jgi:hypothetical protein